jgi:hypothetical protein
MPVHNISMGRMKMNLQLPKEEQKILEAAFKSTEVRKPNVWMGILGLLSGGLMITGGVEEYLTEGRAGLTAIGYGVMFTAYILTMYEHLKFRGTAFSLIKKLHEQKASGQ